MPFDNHTNFAYSTVSGGTAVGGTGAGTIILQPGDGTNFPVAPFNIVVWPDSAQPLASNAEIMRVSLRSGDTLTVTRAQEGSTAKVFTAGYQVAAAITAKEMTDVEGVAQDALDLAGVSSDGNPPSSSPAATVRQGVGGLFVSWTAITNADPVSYDVHLSTSSGFTPGPSTLVGTVNGTLLFVRYTNAGTALVAGTTYFVKIVARDADGSAAAGTQGSGTPIADPETTDGLAPSAVGVVSLVPGIGYIQASWAEVVNADPVVYDVYISNVSGFTPGSGNFFASTPATSILINALHGGTPLASGVTYYIKVIARDADGSAAASSQVGSTISNINTGSLTSDGVLPSTPSTPVVVGGIGYLTAMWTPVTNQADPVRYRVYLSTSSGFSPGTSTLYAETANTSIVIKTTGGTSPVALTYGATYYVKIIAVDADGVSGASTQGSGVPVQAGTGDLSVGSITAASGIIASIDAATITVGTISASQIGVSTLSAISANMGTLTAGTINATATVNAGAIHAGTLDASTITVIHLSASSIDTGTLNVGGINFSGTIGSNGASLVIDAATVTINNLNATKITAGTLNVNSISVSGTLGTNASGLTIDGGHVTLANLDAGQITAGIVGATHLVASALTAIQADIDTLSAIKSNLGTIVAGSILLDGPDMGTVAIDEDGLRLFGTDPTHAVVNLPTDQSTPNYFEGKINASSGITGIGIGLSDEVAINPGTIMTVAAGVAPPLAGLSAAVVWPDKTTIPVDQEQTGLYHQGMFYNTSDNLTYICCQGHLAIEGYSAGGNKSVNFPIDQQGGQRRPYGVVFLGGAIWVLCYGATTGSAHIQKYNATTHAFISDTALTGGSFVNWGALGTDGTDLYFVEINGSGNTCFRKYVLSGGNLAGSGPTSSSVTSGGAYANMTPTGFAAAEGLWWVSYLNVLVNNGSVAKAFTTASTPVYQSNKDFRGTDANWFNGLSHDGTHFWSMPKERTFNRHSNWTWTTESSKYWPSFSYRGKNLMAMQNQADFETSALAADGVTSQTGFGSATLSQQLDTDHGGDTTLIHSGIAALKVDVSAGAGLNSGVLLGDVTSTATSQNTLIPVIPGQTYSISLWMRGSAGGEHIAVDFRYYDASGIRISESTEAVFATLSTTWTEYKVEGIVIPSSVIFAGIRIFTTATGTAYTFYVDDVQVEQNATATTLEYPAETIISPRTGITMVKRAALSLATPPIPEGATYQRFYNNRGTTDPGGGGGSWLQAVYPETHFETAATSVTLESFRSNGTHSPASGMAFGTVESAKIVSGATDPSGEPYWLIDGAGRIRFLGPGLQNQFYMYTDFFEATSLTNQSGALYNVQSGAGASLGGGPNLIDHPGVWQLGTGTTSSGYSIVRSNTGGISIGLAHMRFSALVSLPTLSTSGQRYFAFAGLGDVVAAFGNLSSGNYVGFRYVDSGGSDPGNWELVCCNGSDPGGGSHNLASGIKVNASQWYFLEVDIAGDGTLTWFIDGIQVGQTADGTNTPDGAMGVQIGLQKNIGTTQRVLYVDAFSLYGDFVS